MKETLRKLAGRLNRATVASRVALVFTLAAGLVAGSLLTEGLKARAGSIAPGATALAIPAPAQLSSAFAQIAAELRPSVVNINTESTVKQAGQRSRRGGASPDSQDNPFEQFFGFNPFDAAPKGNMR